MNHWLETHKNMINQVRRAAIEKTYLPQYQGFPLQQVEFLLNGFEKEVLRLQSELDHMKDQIKKE